MRVMADDQVCALVYSQMRKGFLRIIRGVFPFRSPMEIYDNQLGSGFFQRADIILYLLLFLQVIRQFIDSGQPYLHAFDIQDRIGITFVTVILTVVIRQISGFYRAFDQDIEIFRRPLESKFLILPLVGLRQCPFHIHNGEIVRFQDRTDILKEIIRPVYIIESVQTGGISEISVRSERTVAHGTYRNSNRFVCR